MAVRVHVCPRVRDRGLDGDDRATRPNRIAGGGIVNRTRSGDLDLRTLQRLFPAISSDAGRRPRIYRG